MKKTLPLLTTALFCLFFTGFLSAQSLYPVSENEKIQRSSLIIEGKVVAQQSFWNPQHTMIFTSNKIELYKIFKGDINSNYIEVLSAGGTVDNINIIASDLLELSKDDVGIFFCYDNSISLRSPSTNAILYDVWSSSQGFYKYDLKKQEASAPFVSYENITGTLYRSLTAKTGRNFENKKPAFKIDDYNTGNRLTAVNIASFSPASVIAGAFSLPAENTLTINGSGFGTPTGSAAIEFDNPDNGTGGTPLVIAATSDLIISWSDTKIEVEVPAKAGTGTFNVIDNGGGSGTSPSALDVKYAILSGTFGSIPTNRQYCLMNLNGSGGYDYLYCTSTLNSGVDFSVAPQEPPFSRAISTWRETAGLNFSYTGTTTTQTVNPGDGINIIMMDNTGTGQPVLPSGVLAVCYSSGSSCGGNQFIRRAGFDIVVRNSGVSAGSTNFNNGPCKTSTAIAEYDMESVMLHELGHALNLGHINDTYIGSWPNVDPGKLMNYAIVNGVDRRSPDWSAYTGASYNINPKSMAYGGCTLQTEMIPLSITLESKDECPVSFPSSETPTNTVVNFDLTHATSNKYNDPQYTAVKIPGTGTGITNNAFYALKTGAAGTLDINVSGYVTNPASQSACGGAGIELSLYQASVCPTAHSYPAPVAYRTFNSNGTLTAITGLSSNTNYLIMVDGISNTKASFDLLLNGSVLPVSILSFKGQKENKNVKLTWEIANEYNNDRFEIETSKDGNLFYKIGQVDSRGNASGVSLYTYVDNQPAEGINFYRLRQVDIDNRQTLSATIIINFNSKKNITLLYPNPVEDKLTLVFDQPSTKAAISIYSNDGKLMNRMVLAGGLQNFDVDTRKLFAGVYFIKIITATENQTLRFIKK